MKLFLKRILIFFSPVVIIIALWEYGLNTIPNSYSLKRAQLESQAGQIEVLVLGGSHALRGVNPAYFSMKGYNAANVNQSLYYDEQITYKYLDKMHSLKLVLMDMSYISLWFQLDKSKENWREYFYADYWNIQSPEIKWYDLRMYSKILCYGNYLSWQYALKGFNVNLAQGYLNNGWAAKQNGRAVPEDAMITQAVGIEKKSFGLNNIGNNVNDLKVFLIELNKRNIDVIFYRPPVTNKYSKCMNKGTLQIIDSILNVLCSNYHCKQFDYTNDQRFSDSDFKDLAHLNATGATKFSKIINDEILKPYYAPVDK